MNGTSQTTTELAQARDHYRNTVFTPERLEAVDRATEELIASGIRKSVLKEGTRVEDFILMDTRGNPVRLQTLLSSGPVVISFYRGGWCPYCNIELRGLQRALPEITALRASLVAISPQLPDNSLSTEGKNKLAFPVLSDVGNRIARRFGIVFTLPDFLLETYNGRLTKANGKFGERELPVPATFVLDRTGTIRLTYFEEDYTKRIAPEAIVDALRGLRK